MTSELVLRAVRASDAAALAEIYNHYIRETIITFEEAEIDARDMSGRIAEVTKDLPWIVGERGGVVIGYAYGAKWKTRSAYRHSVESTVYLAEGEERKGYGRALYRALIDLLKARGVHVVLGGIALPNAASVALHESCGFKKVGQLSEVGLKFGRWIDVGYWQLTLNA